MVPIAFNKGPFSGRYRIRGETSDEFKEFEKKS